MSDFWKTGFKAEHFQILLSDDAKRLLGEEMVKMDLERAQNIADRANRILFVELGKAKTVYGVYPLPIWYEESLIRNTHTGKLVAVEELK